MSDETAVAIRMADLSPEYAEIMVLGNVLQKSGYFKDVRDQAQAVTKILFGRELGFSPIVSMGGIHIIEGKPALSSNLMATLIKRSGKYDYRVKAWTVTECVLSFRQKEAGQWEDVGESSFDMNDAKAAGVLRPSGSWSKYPKAMLFARALSQGLRTYCPDVSAAPIYNPEEMGATVGEDGDVIELPKSATPKPEVQRSTEETPVVRPAKVAAAPTQKGEPKTAARAEAPGPEASATVPVNVQRVIKRAQEHHFDTVDNGVRDPSNMASGNEMADLPVPRDRMNINGPKPLPPLEDLVKTAEANMSAKAATLPADHVDTGQAANFHRFFKDALKPALRKNELALSHAWLKKQGIVDSNGEPTAKAILKDNFYQVREAAIEYAKSVEL